ncbi:MAG: esterase-like activity of phytase family protein [Pseudomonadota bacterium]
MELTGRQIESFAQSMPEGARLGFRGGLVLRGPRAFGALSALVTRGDQFLAATDTGHFVDGAMVLDDGWLKGLAAVRLTPRMGLSGMPVRSKSEGDAEALTLADGSAWVLVESSRNVLAYPIDGLRVDADATPRAVPVPPAVRQLGRKGIEAMATLPGGEMLFTAEGRDGTDTVTAAYRTGAGRFAVARREGYAITGADALPGGDVVIVERRWRGGLDVAMRVRRLGRDAIAAGAIADGPVLLEAGIAAEIDNMEAIAAEIVDGKIALTLVSDDNHNFFQRTLMLRFIVTDPLPRPNPRRPET